MSGFIKLADEYITPITSKLEDGLLTMSGKTVDAASLPKKLGSKHGVKTLEMDKSQFNKSVSELTDDKGNVNVDDVLNLTRIRRRDYTVQSEITGTAVPVRTTKTNDEFILESYQDLVNEFAYIDDAPAMRAEFTDENIDVLRKLHEGSRAQQAPIQDTMEYYHRFDELEAHLKLPPVSDGSVTYRFPDQAYHDVTLPDTDLASYKVTIYNNSTTDKKGVRVGETHYDEPNDFHTRTDKVVPGVHRIQELQSDVQNVLTDKKNAEITKWQQQAEAMEFGHDDIARHVNVRGLPGNAASALSTRGAEIRGEVGMKWLENTSASTGLDFTNIRAPHMLSVTGLMQETMTAIGNKFVDGATFDTVRHTPLGHYLDMLAKGQAPAEMAPETKKLLKTHTDLTEAEIGSIEDVIANAADDFDHLSDPFIDKHNKQVKQERMDRRRTGDRTEAALSSDAQYSDNTTAAETKIAKQQLSDSYVEVLEKNDLVVNGTPANTQQIGKSVAMEVLDKPWAQVQKEINDFYTRTGRPIPKSHNNPGGQLFEVGPAKHTKRVTREGRMIFNEVYGEGIGDRIADVSKQVYRSATKKTTEKLNKEHPLKKFPKAKEFELEVSWQKQGVQSEVAKAIQDGNEEVWLNINAKGTEDHLGRGEGPQALYETDGSINENFRAVARKIKAEIVEEDGYLKMKLPQAAAGIAALASFNTYADTNRDDFVADVVAQGVSEEKATAYWYDYAKKSENEYQSKREEARSAGMTDKQIDEYEDALLELETFATPTEGIPVEGSNEMGMLAPDTVVQIGETIGADPYTPDGIDAIYKHTRDLLDPEGKAERLETETKNAQNYVVQLEEVYNWSNPYQEARALFGNEEADAALQTKTGEIRASIVEAAKARGYELAWDAENSKWIAKLPNGDIVDATPDTMAYLARDLGAIGFSMAGGAAGIAVISPVTNALYAAPGLPGKAGALGLQMLFGTMFGFAGSIIGEEADYVVAATQADEALSWEVAYNKLGGAVQEEAMGLFAMAIIAGGWKSAKSLVGLGRMIKDGNLTGAYNMLKTTTGLNDKQIKKAIEDWTTLNQMDAPYRSINPASREMEQALAIIPTTRAGGQNVIKAVSERDPTASGQIANEVAARASALTEALALPTTDVEFATRLSNEYRDYVLASKKHYQVIKDSGVDYVDEGYQFNVDKLVTRTLNKDLITRMETDPAVDELRNEMARLSEIYKSRTFDSLLELHKTIENIKLQSKSGDLDVFDDILGKIDKEIERTVLSSGKEGNLQWYADWIQAKSTRTDMLRVQQRSLGRTLETAAKEVRSGGEIGYDQIIGEILDSGHAVKGILPELMKQMPIDTQIAIERDMIKTVVDAWTIGKRGEFQAMQFPEIAAMLREHNFQFPESRAMVKLINDFAKVYQNDVGLALASGKIHSVQFQSYLTTNPVVRAQFEIASEVFNRVQEIRGGALGDSAAMIRHTAKLLADPLNPKNVSEALQTAKGDVMLEKAIANLSREAAAAKHTGNLQTTRLITFKDGRGNLYTKGGQGRTEVGTIPMHRMVVEEDVLNQYEIGSLDDLTIFNRAELINRGLIGISLPDGKVFKLADDLF